MRAEADASRIREFLRRFGQEVRGPGTIYLTGGATALLLGWRQATLDVDLSMDPEPAGAFEAIARFPAIEPDELRAKVLSCVASLESAP